MRMVRAMVMPRSRCHMEIRSNPKIAAVSIAHRSHDMKKMIAAAAILALTTGVVYAATDTGKVIRIDSQKDAVTLEDGKTFTLSEGVEAESFKVGQIVKVTYDSKDGKLVASKILAK